MNENKQANEQISAVGEVGAGGFVYILLHIGNKRGNGEIKTRPAKKRG
jgi:hypothetical protein